MLHRIGSRIPTQPPTPRSTAGGDPVQRWEPVPEDVPDLLEQDLDAGERRFLEQVVRALDRWDPRAERMRLAWCQWSPGALPLTLALWDEGTCLEVRSGDPVHAGVALCWLGEGTVEVATRLYRRFDGSGLVVFQGLRPRRELHASEALGAVLRALGRARFEATVARLQRSARLEVTDPRMLLEDARILGEREAIERVRAESEDPSAWGWIAAACRVAAREPDGRRRLLLEEDAERLQSVVERQSAGLGDPALHRRLSELEG